MATISVVMITATLGPRISPANNGLRVGGTFFYGFHGPKVPETWAL